MNDHTAPDLLSLSLTDLVDAGGSPTLKLDAEATDETRVSWVGIVWTRTLSIRTAAGEKHHEEYSIFNFSDPWTSGRRSSAVTVQKINEPGTYSIRQLTVGDGVGNARTYDHAELTALHFDTSFTLTGVTPDRTLPVLKALYMPRTLDISNGPARLEMTAKVSDDLSTVDSVYVEFDRPLLVSYQGSGTSTHVRPMINDYRDTTELHLKGSQIGVSDQSSPSPAWVAAENGVHNIKRVGVTDKAGNVMYYDQAAIKELGLNTQLTVTDGTAEGYKLVTSVHTQAATADQSGMVVLKILTTPLRAGTNTIALTIRHHYPDNFKFEGWAGVSPGSFNLKASANPALSNQTTISGTIDTSVADAGQIELRFKPDHASGVFTYNIADVTINGRSLSDISMQAQGYRIPTLLEGTAGADTLSGDAGDNVIHAGAGNDLMLSQDGHDLLFGGDGADTAVYAGVRALYQVERSDDELVVRSTLRASKTVSTIDRLNSVETIRFDDISMAFDPNSDVAQVYRLYKAAFDRAPDAAGLGFWVHAREAGISLHDIAAGFVASKEFTTLYGASASNASIVNGFYQNVLDRQPDAGGTAFWEDVLERKAADVADVLTGFSDSAENQAGLATLIGQGMSYIPHS